MPHYVKNDHRSAKGWWVPGSYENTCTRCKEQYLGNEHSAECADCAYKEPDHIVVSADGEYRDSLVWVCTRCWPTTNEVLTLGRNMRIVTHCEICERKSENDDDLNAIWKSWIARVLQRHWEEHKA